MKRSLVIGGTRGIGRVVVRTLLKEGHAVAVIDRQPPLDKDRRLRNARYWAVDLLDRDRLGEVLRQIRKLDNLVFCQRFRGDGDAWLGEFQTSLSATKYVVEQCRSKGVGSIVVMGSIAAHWVANEQPVGYHAFKAALVQMVRYLAVTLGPKGCRVNCVSPGTVLKEESAEFYRRNRALTSLYKQIIPLGRMGTARDVADVVAFLCSDRAAFVTGQEIIVDGGLSLQGQEALARRVAGLDRIRTTQRARKG